MERQDFDLLMELHGRMEEINPRLLFPKGEAYRLILERFLVVGDRRSDCPEKTYHLSCLSRLSRLY
jgi:hypothetical protein